MLGKPSKGGVHRGALKAFAGVGDTVLHLSL